VTFLEFSQTFIQIFCENNNETFPWEFGCWKIEEKQIIFCPTLIYIQEEIVGLDNDTWTNQVTAAEGLFAVGVNASESAEVFSLSEDEALWDTYPERKRESIY
jgi:hypothetical protein